MKILKKNKTEKTYELDYSINMEVYIDDAYIDKSTIGEFVQNNADIFEEPDIKYQVIKALCSLSESIESEFHDFYSGTWKFKKIII